MIFFNAAVHEFDSKSCLKTVELFLWRLMALYAPHLSCYCPLSRENLWLYFEINLFFNHCLCIFCTKWELWPDSFHISVAVHFVTLTRHHEARSDVATVQESCTLLDTQSQQGMYKRRQVQLPAVFSQEKHTHFSQNIMASTLIN